MDKWRFGLGEGVSEWWGCCRELVGQVGGGEAVGRRSEAAGLERDFNMYSFTNINNFSFSLI